MVDPVNFQLIEGFVDVFRRAFLAGMGDEFEASFTRGFINAREF